MITVPTRMKCSYILAMNMAMALSRWLNKWPRKSRKGMLVVRCSGACDDIKVKKVEEELDG